MIVGGSEYFEKIWNEAVYEKVSRAPERAVSEVRNRDAWNLTHYVDIIDKQRAGCEFRWTGPWSCSLQEAGGGKMFYPAKATLPKKKNRPLPRPALPAGAPAAPRQLRQPPEAEKK